MRKVKTSAILKRPLNKLFTVKNTYHDANQTDKAREQKLRQEAAVICELMLTAWTLGGDRSCLNITNINILNRFNKAREIFPIVIRVLNILLTAAATSVERVNSKELV